MLQLIKTRTATLLFLICLLFGFIAGCSPYYLNKGDVVKNVNPKSKYYQQIFRCTHHEMPDEWGIGVYVPVSTIGDTNYCSTYQFYISDLRKVEMQAANSK